MIFSDITIGGVSVREWDAKREIEKKWEKENGYEGMDCGYPTCKILCYRFDQVSNVTDLGQSNVQVLLTGSPLVYIANGDMIRDVIYFLLDDFDLHFLVKAYYHLSGSIVTRLYSFVGWSQKFLLPYLWFTF